ncbi:MAG: hypothetical protein DMG01_25320 [Acidobacteria bacterium]|nr:MAG: hypothetical protein DMG01_25320 [Acidobacteriota bacterium]
MFERYCEAARRTLFFARFETSQLGGVAIETEHVLLGLLRDNKGLTRTIFTRAQLTYADVHREIEARGAGERVSRRSECCSTQPLKLTVCITPISAPSISSWAWSARNARWRHRS